MRIALQTVLAGAWTLLACTRHGDPPPAGGAKAEPKVEPEPAPVVEVKPEPEPKVEPAPPPPPKPPPPPDNATKIEPEPGVVTWTELPGMSEIQGFHPFVIGTLADCWGWCKLYDDGRLEPTSIPAEFGNQKIWGIWRSDAWVVEVKPNFEEDPDDDRGGVIASETIEFSRWRGSGFQRQKLLDYPLDDYVPDPQTGRFEGGAIFHKGWAGGMLFYQHHRGGWSRIPDSGPPPPSVRPPAKMVDFFEAESGAILFVTYDLSVHPPCPAGSCSEQIFKLPDTVPKNSRWLFPLDVARGGDSMTIVIDDELGGAYLLHYDSPEPGVPGRWSFEQLPEDARVDVIWPDTRGGVWMGVEDGVWYRNKDGRWYDVALPGASIDFANRLKPREFLALVEGPEGNRLFATRGPVKAGPAPAAPSVPETGPGPAAAPVEVPMPKP